VDIRPSRISLDHTGGGTLGSASLSTCVREGVERLLGVGKGYRIQLQRGVKEGTVRRNDW